jgi:hypothetical protein
MIGSRMSGEEPRDDQRRPVVGTGVEEVIAATSISIAGHCDIPGLTHEQSRILHNWIADANGIPADRLALVAVVETISGHYRRRVFLSLEAAHRAFERASDRGLDARVVLCELRPLDGT